MRHLLHQKERSIGSQWEVDMGEGYKSSFNKLDCIKDRKTDNSRNEVSLKLIQVDIEGAIKAEWRSDGRDDLHNQLVQVCEARPCNIEAILTNVIDSFIVNLKSHASASQPQTLKSHQRYPP